MDLISRATPAVAVAQNVIADDISRYGVVAISILTVLSNAFPQFGLPGSWQAVIDAVIGVLTALSAVNKQKAVATAKAAVAVKAAKKAAK